MPRTILDEKPLDERRIEDKNVSLLLDQRARPERGPLATWTRSYAMTLTLLRSTLEQNKSSLWRARLITDKAAVPIPLKISLQKIYIPRRKDVLPEGMSAKDATGVLKAEWVDYHPHTDQHLPAERVILYVHGGAYFICSRKTHRGITYRVAKYAHARVLAIDYRLSPESTFPTPLNDVLSAYLFLIDPPPHTGAPRYHPSQVTFMGDSAGAALAVSTVLWLRDHKPSIPMPGALALISPWLDLTHSMPSWRLNNGYDYLPDGLTDRKYVTPTRSHVYVTDNSQLSHPLVSPMFAREHPHRPLPPTLIHAGDAEKLRDEIINFTERSFPSSPIQLELYEDQPHVFHMLAPLDPMGKCALKRMGSWTKDIMSRYTAHDTEVTIPHTVTRVLNRPTNPVIPITDPLAIIDEAREILRERGKWVDDVKGGHPRASSASDEARRVMERDPAMAVDKEIVEKLGELAVLGPALKRAALAGGK
ncbi:Alpha/Beta hydrolase protein [Fimicolochytrium jonesii]|uniref:Alpha/Beta hydrolase protein n=1 Tax=Fimicolochytrium jonesii TaxID=1396493 RepID=UPI0022FEB0CE|nr:Alpha/Beta hydrolase protein [Fimicolochytrium jonesii]KAI8815882.1 Alpha/Beta hydrolase protein [Fimicolochytrium jonesii]